MINITFVIVLVYLVGILFIAFYFSKRLSLDSYFTNQKKTGLWFLTFSHVSSDIGAGMAIGLVAAVYVSGISWGLIVPVYLVTTMLVMAFLSKKIKNFGDEHNAVSLVDFFSKRFDNKNKVLVMVLQLFLIVLWVALQAVALSSLATVLIGISFHVALVLSLVVMVLYTAVGGLKIDFITDFIQFWIIFLVFLVMAVLTYFQVGGFEILFTNLPEGHLNPFAYGGILWFVGALVVSGFSDIGNTSFWQRIVSSKDASTARKSFLLAAPFVFLIAILLFFLGLSSSILVPGVSEEVSLFALMGVVFGPVLLGVGFAAILAIIMSTTDSMLIGGSTIVYTNFIGGSLKLGKNPLVIARIVTVIIALLSFLVALLFPTIIGLTIFLFYLALLFVPATLFGLYSKRISSNASFYSILLPAIALFTLFPIIGNNIFVVTLSLGVLILVFYDRFFSRKT